jgi:hypothetical protein
MDGNNYLYPGNWFTALVFGVSSGLLGVSGFETSANFVEEQAPGVFPKTLRNMWAAVGFYNPGSDKVALGSLSTLADSIGMSCLCAYF